MHSWPRGKLIPCVMAVAALLSIPDRAPGQVNRTAIVPGDTVRLVTLDRREAIGRLVSRTADSLYLASPHGSYGLHVASVRGAQVQRGTYAGDFRLLSHVVGGAIVGTLAWFVGASVIECGSGRCAGGEGSIVALFGSPIGALAGAIIGGVHANRNPVPRWIPATLSP